MFGKENGIAVSLNDHLIRSGSLPVHRVVSQSINDGRRLDLAQKYFVHRGEEGKLVLLSLRFEHHVHLMSRLRSLQP